MKKRKGFTLVELLVVIAIIALLMGILMPALARVRQIAYRLYCGTNLSGLGKAMLIYCNDYDDELSRAVFRYSAGCPNCSHWTPVSGLDNNDSRNSQLADPPPNVEGDILGHHLATSLFLPSRKLPPNDDNEQPSYPQNPIGMIVGLGLLASGSSRKGRKRDNLLPYIRAYTARVTVYLERCRPYKRPPAAELEALLGTGNSRIGWLVEEAHLERKIRTQLYSLLETARKGRATTCKRRKIDRDQYKLRCIRAML